MTTVTLRSLNADDADAVFELLSDDRVIAHMLFPRFTRERAAAFVARFPSPEPAGTPPQVVFAIVDRQDEAIAGLCGVVLDGAQGELWYLLRPALWGRGIGTMAAAALVTHAFRQLGLHRVWASCVPENPASARVLEKLGFRREGHHRQNLLIQGAWRDSYTYALLGREHTGAGPQGSQDRVP